MREVRIVRLESDVTDRVILDSTGVLKPATNDGAALGKSGTAWADLFLASGAVVNFAAGDLTVTHSPGVLDFSAGIYRFNTSNSAPGAGNNVTGNVIGSTIYASSTSTVMLANRTTDGTLMVLSSQGVQQGSIAIAGSTTSYNAFFGSHWSQLSDGSRPELLKGTILESIDEMCAWPDEAPEERLPRFKVSDTPASKAVYGVFAWWDQSEVEKPVTNDVLSGGLGAYVIEAIGKQDFAIVRTMVFVGSLLYIATYILIDLAYSWADPRVRLA